jgi:hypothetical protein
VSGSPEQWLSNLDVHVTPGYELMTWEFLPISKPLCKSHDFFIEPKPSTVQEYNYIKVTQKTNILIRNKDASVKGTKTAFAEKH